MTDPSSSEAAQHTFRIRYTRMYLWMLAILVPVISAASIHRFGAGLHPVALMLGLSFGALAAAAGTAAIVFVYPLRLNEQGIEGFDFWGRRAKLPWTDARRIRPFGIVGLPGLLLGQEGASSALFLPLFLEHPQHFADALERFAGPDHPLVLKLKDQLRAAA